MPSRVVVASTSFTFYDCTAHTEYVYLFSQSRVMTFIRSSITDVRRHGLFSVRSFVYSNIWIL